MPLGVGTHHVFDVRLLAGELEARLMVYRGTSLIRKRNQDPTVGLCLGS